MCLYYSKWKKQNVSKVVNELKRQKLIKLRGNRSRPPIAKEIGITPQMLGMIERGERTPSLPLAKKIADYYGVTVEEIFFDNEDTKCVHKNKTA